MGRHARAGNSWSHPPEPKGAKGENWTEPLPESMVVGRTQSIAAQPGARRKIPFPPALQSPASASHEEPSRKPRDMRD